MEDDRLRHLLHQPCGCMCTKRLMIPTEVLFTDSRGTMVAERGRSVYGPRPTKDASKQNETGSKHCTALEHTAWRSRAVARTGDWEAWDWPGRNIGVNKHGVTKECQCQESVLASRTGSGWRSGSARYRCRLQMTAIANRYLISRQRERRTRGMCNQKGRRTLGEARMPTAPSLAWAVPGAVIKVK